MHKTAKTLFVILGIIPTVLAFIYHETLCTYEMNPLCFFASCVPLIVAMPILVCEDGDF